MNIVNNSMIALYSIKSLGFCGEEFKEMMKDRESSVSEMEECQSPGFGGGGT